MGPVGSTEKITDKNSLDTDHKRGMYIMSGSLLIGVLVAIIAVMI